MEPVGHMAGLAASIITATATVSAIAIAAPIGQAFDGTLVPLTNRRADAGRLGLLG